MKTESLLGITAARGERVLTMSTQPKEQEQGVKRTLTVMRMQQEPLFRHMLIASRRQETQEDVNEFFRGMYFAYNLLPDKLRRKELGQAVIDHMERDITDHSMEGSGNEGYSNLAWFMRKLERTDPVPAHILAMHIEDLSCNGNAREKVWARYEGFIRTTLPFYSQKEADVFENFWGK